MACRPREDSDDSFHPNDHLTLSGVPVGPVESWEMCRTSLFRFEGASQLPVVYRPESWEVPTMPAKRTVSFGSRARPLVAHKQAESPSCSRAALENSIASTSIFSFQATKSQRWMPWRLKPKKDVGGCDKPRGAADRASIRGCPNEETRHPSWGVTPA